MKARIKATGEIVDVELSHYIGGVTWYITKCLASYYENELEFIDTPEDYWTRLEHQYAGMAMQGLVLTASKHMGTDQEMAQWAKEYAHALVEKMKEGRK